MTAGHHVRINGPIIERKGGEVTAEVDQEIGKNIVNRLFHLVTQVTIDHHPEIAIIITDKNRDRKVDSDRRDHLLEDGGHSRHQDERIMTTGHIRDGPHQPKIKPTGQILEINSKVDHDLPGVLNQRIDTIAR